MSMKPASPFGSITRCFHGFRPAADAEAPCAVIDEKIAAALLPERPWDALLIDYPLARAMTENCDLNRLHIPKRIAMIRPSERHELQALKAAGFTGYLVKPVRAASLAARLAVTDTFEHSASEVAPKQPTPRLAQSKVCRSWLPTTTKLMRCWRVRSSRD